MVEDTAFSRLNLLYPIYIGASTISTKIGTSSHLVFWNFHHKTENDASKHYKFWSGYFARAAQYFVYPIVVGVHGDRASFKASDLQVLESNGTVARPASLFEAQLSLRQGYVPTWLQGLKDEWDVLRTMPLTPPNILVQKTIDNIGLFKNDSVDIDLSENFAVLHSETANQSASSADVNIATVSISGGILTVTGVGAGMTTVTLTASTFDQEVNLEFNVDVSGPPPPEISPIVRSVRGSDQELLVSWHDPSSTNVGYDLRYILTSDNELDDSNWTLVEDAVTSGSLEYSISTLTNNLDYDIQVRSKNESGTSFWSDTFMGTPSSTVDYDADDDGLIEVYNFTQLNALRYDLNGDGLADNFGDNTNYSNAFPNPVSSMGCPSTGCNGYELEVLLDFNDSAWTMGSGWEPIGTDTNRFTAIFDGGGNILSNLFIDRTGDAGLFGTSSGIIKNVGLVDVNVEGTGKAGGLLSRNDGKVSNCFVTGQISSSDTAGGLVGSNSDTIRTSYSRANVVNTRNGGGLVGNNEGALLACYATGEVSTNRSAGGLVGWNPSSASIKYCYATGSVSSSGTGADGQRVGGFFGGLQSPWSSREYGLSYWNKETTGRSSRAGDRFITHSNHQKIRNNIKGKTTSQLQSPTGYTDIYASWDDEDVTSDGIADAPWDFGTSSQYPALKVDFDNNGIATVEEFGNQR